MPEVQPRTKPSASYQQSLHSSEGERQPVADCGIRQLMMNSMKRNKIEQGDLRVTRKAVCAPLQTGLSRKTSQLKQNKTTNPEKGGGKNQTNIWGSRVFQARSSAKS